MHQRDTATEKESDTVLQITLQHVLIQRFKQNTKWKAKITNIITQIRVNALKPRNSPSKMLNLSQIF